MRIANTSFKIAHFQINGFLKMQKNLRYTYHVLDDNADLNNNVNEAKIKIVV